MHHQLTQKVVLALTRRFADKRFIEHYDSTIGIDYGSTIVNIPNSIPIKCQIWDTGGSEQFKPIIHAYYGNISAAIITYDVCNSYSFENVLFTSILSFDSISIKFVPIVSRT